MIKSKRLICASLKTIRSAFNILIGKPKRKRPLGRPRLRWEDNIKMDI